ncbi:uncharacterized protein [Henckelia pumila]|uniref:uncharacterized protein n=1 Tax=Henckelia pumila TaxID=405737 RepID=UPI003C6E2A2A
MGVPRRLISDNGRHIQGAKIQAWCKEMKIQQAFTSVAYPQSNGQVEVTNRSLVQGLKTRLGKSKGKWVDELPSVLWAYRTTPREGTKETTLNLVYEKREAAAIRLEAYKSRMTQAYNRRVVQRSFQVDDLVLKKVQEEQRWKLDPKWDDPFKVIEKLSSGAYYLEDKHGKALKRPWNAYHLRKYYRQFTY